MFLDFFMISVEKYASSDMLTYYIYPLFGFAVVILFVKLFWQLIDWRL